MGVKVKKFNIMGVHWNIQFLQGFMKKTMYGGNWIKKGVWIVCRFKKGLGKKRGWYLWVGWYSTPVHAMVCTSIIQIRIVIALG